MSIRKAESGDLSRIAEIYVFNNRINYFPIFKDEKYSFGEMQVVPLVNNYFGREEMVEQKGEYTAMPQARAQTMHYMKGLKGAAALRRCCCTLSRLEDLDELIAAVFEEQRKAGLDPDDVREVPFP